MKKARLSCLLLALSLLLASCGGKPAKPFVPAATAEALLACGAFSETLEALDAALIYDELDPATLKDSAVYASTGATAEEIAVLTLQDETAAKAALAVLKGRIDAQKEALREYQPDEISKLEHAILEQRGSTVLLVVSNDADKAKAALEKLDR